MKYPYQLVSAYKPTGDQPAAIDALCAGLETGRRFQTLEGVTGSGKTFTIANVIARQKRPALVISHNKTLAAQLYAELKSFFPHNAVEFFISYYDYYQPEAYIPQTDTFIEKDASINSEIERLRLAATDSLLGRDDVIIVASVSCIYGLGSPEDYREMVLSAHAGETFGRDDVLEKLVSIQYDRNDYEPQPGTFRVRGDTVDIFPSYATHGIRVEFFGDEVDSIKRIDPLTGEIEENMDRITISPAKHFVMPAEKLEPAIARIEAELEERVKWFEQRDKLIEAQRIRMRTAYDIEMMREIGYCGGIENYSRHLGGRQAGDRPACLIDYFPDNFLTVIDESHVTLPQVRGMFNGDQARKRTLVEHGFRLPSALDNRPLEFNEFMDITGQMIFTTATPGPFEVQKSGTPVEQVIRPTGIIDPPVEVRPLSGQIDDVMEEIRSRAERGERTLVTTLTKRTAEDLTDYLKKVDLRVQYLHSDIDAIERVEILRGLRKAEFDCLIGINLLREGLDLPEVSLVAILDADKEGFLRSETALVQTAGRAARHIEGRVIMYADNITGSMQRMIDVTNRRRERQMAYNEEHGVVPQAIQKEIADSLKTLKQGAEEVEEMVVCETGESYDVNQAIREIEQEMLDAAAKLEFERAALLRDELYELKSQQEPTAPATKGARKLYVGRKKRSTRR
ncbi:excinuclease ABC subunit UvrB [Tichowtungia aerotolerans]|uniref:UvrABC system protein B n=1 Tax=Tichowtungia aerotolerans TaxID=2697043 RepID=A0A6P1M6H8_9BACT|nr:excinuclease ABC subunit UvrB [Tichowtungia aerotolerans]QHI68204.1 excinuclease ABC subunit UvrB [Tichowtungia aerotolerans]